MPTPTFFTLLTNSGKARVANAIALGQDVDLSQMAVGDGNGNPTTPNETQTALVREKFRASINQLTIDPANPNYLIAEMIVPTTTGGWTVYEVGVFDSAGNLFAVANFPATYKPQLAEGSGRDLIIRIYIQVSNASVVNLMVDPAVVLASQAWVAANYSLAKLIPGGTTTQILAKNSNADGDTRWVDPTAAVNVIVATVEETQTLAANQVIIDLATVTTQGVGVYIEGARLRLDEFTKTSSTRVTLAQSRPAGTKVTLVQNDQTGVNLLALKTSIGNFANVFNFTANQSLSAVHAGSYIKFTMTAGVNATASLPSSGIDIGAVFSITNAVSSLGQLTVTCSGGFGSVLSSGGATSFAMAAGGSQADFIYVGAGQYDIVNGSGSHSKSQQGFTRTPGGIFIQWGNSSTNAGTGIVDIVFPFKFPNVVASLVISEAAASNWAANSCTQFGCDLKTLTGARVYTRQINGSGASINTGFFNYIATGY